MIALSTPKLWIFSPFPHPILHIRLLDIGSGQLVQRGVEGQVAQGGVEDVDDIQLGDAGGHGAGAEEGLIGGGVELFIGQVRDGGFDEAGDGDGGGAVFLQGLHALDHLYGSAGVRNDDAYILGGGVSGLEELGVPVLVEDAELIGPEKFQVGVFGGAEGSAHAEEVDDPGPMQQVYAAPEGSQIHQLLCLLQRDDVPIGDFFNDLLQRVVALNGLLLVPLGLVPDGQLIGHGLAEIPVAGVADVVAQPDDGGGGAEDLLGQASDAVVQHQIGVADDLGGDGPLRRAQGLRGLPQAQNGIAHSIASRYRFKE